MLRIFRFGDTDSTEHFLNGGICGGRQLPGGKILGLHGLTLIFNTPSATVTFSDPTGVGLSVQDIATQITTVASTLKVGYYNGYMRIIEISPSGGVVLDSAGTANTIFGFSAAADTTGTVYAPPDGDAPRLVDFESSARMDGFAIVVEV